MIRVPLPTDHLVEIEERRRIAAELDAIEALKAQRLELIEPFQQRLNDAHKRYADERDAIYAAQSKAQEGIDEKINASVDALRGRLGQDHPWRMRFGGHIIRCALTGLPIHDDEIVLEDDHGEQIAIRAVLFDDEFNFFERDEDEEDEEDDATDADGEPF